MANFKLYIKPSAIKEINKLPKKDIQRIISKIESLTSDPRPSGAIKLTTLGHYRIRYGNYRIIYSIQDDELIIIVIKVGHRKDIYR